MLSKGFQGQEIDWWYSLCDVASGSAIGPLFSSSNLNISAFSPFTAFSWFKKHLISHQYSIYDITVYMHPSYYQWNQSQYWFLHLFTIIWPKTPFRGWLIWPYHLRPHRIHHICLLNFFQNFHPIFRRDFLCILLISSYWAIFSLSHDYSPICYFFSYHFHFAYIMPSGHIQLLISGYLISWYIYIILIPF